MTLMARPKNPPKNKGGRPPVEHPRRRVVSLRCSDPFIEWLEGLEAQTRMPATLIIEHAVIKWAKEVAGYTAEAPKR